MFRDYTCVYITYRVALRSIKPLIAPYFASNFCFNPRDLNYQVKIYKNNENIITIVTSTSSSSGGLPITTAGFSLQIGASAFCSPLSVIRSFRAVARPVCIYAQKCAHCFLSSSDDRCACLCLPSTVKSTMRSGIDRKKV